MLVLRIALVLCVACAVQCKPVVENNPKPRDLDHRPPRLWKRFINPSYTMGEFTDNTLPRMRTRRGTGEDCEKLQLCKLHARSNRNFFSAFELYFVNKENAHLWDHQTHSIADCERRFGECYQETAPAHARKQYQFVDDDYE